MCPPPILFSFLQALQISNSYFVYRPRKVQAHVLSNSFEGVHQQKVPEKGKKRFSITALETSIPRYDNLPAEIIMEVKEAICLYVTGCISTTMYNCVFLDNLEEGDVRAVYKKGTHSK